MWLSEGKVAGGTNIDENHTEEAMLVTALVHNDEGDKRAVLTLPTSENGQELTIRAGEAMAFTCLIGPGRAITCDGGSGPCRFSIFVHTT
jgi:hypothetical protein